MMECDSTHFNIKTFYIVLTPAFGTATIPITILPSRQRRRKEKIQNIFKLKKPLK